MGVKKPALGGFRWVFGVGLQDFNVFDERAMIVFFKTLWTFPAPRPQRTSCLMPIFWLYGRARGFLVANIIKQILRGEGKITNQFLGFFQHFFAHVCFCSPASLIC